MLNIFNVVTYMNYIIIVDVSESTSCSSVSTSTTSYGDHLDQIEPILIDRGSAGSADKLPWGAVKDNGEFPESVRISTNTKPGQFVLQTLFAEFTVQAERKIEQVLAASVSG